MSISMLNGDCQDRVCDRLPPDRRADARAEDEEAIADHFDTEDDESDVAARKLTAEFDRILRSYGA